MYAPALPTIAPADDPPIQRLHPALTASLERQLLERLARRAPAWIAPDQLTVCGALGQLLCGVSYACAGTHHGALWLVNFGLVLHWAGDSLDGTLARVRNRQRPRFGFYVDHILDCLGATLMLGGLGASGLVHGFVAAAMLVVFLLLAAESFLATHTLRRFSVSTGWFGPTELRLLLIAANFAVLRSPYVQLFGRRWLLFDVGGAIGAAAMSCLLLWIVARHTAELYRQELLP